jgi:hypothetical protein
VKEWTVERRDSRGLYVWCASSREEALDGFDYFSRRLPRGTLHLLDPDGRVVMWCKASYVVGIQVRRTRLEHVA